MKKICFITQCSLPIPTVKGGAVETLVEYLLDENEIKNNFKFVVYSVGDDEAERKSHKYQYTTIKYIEKSDGKLNKILFRLDRAMQHLGIYIPCSVEFYRMLKQLRKEKDIDYFIYEAGQTTQLPLLARFIPKEKLLVHIHWDGMANKKKDSCFSRLIAVSDYIGRCWKNGSGCEENKVIVLPNCAKIERFNIDTSETEKIELRNKLGIPQNHRVVIFTGRIVKEKGVKELLTAFDQLRTELVTLVIVGSANFGASTNTEYEKAVETIINKSKRNIVFTGFIHQTDLYKYYSIADVAVMPSLFQDPAPLVSIETQATGTPLVATRVGGIPEYVGNEDCGILVDQDEHLVENLRNKIDYLLENEEVCENMKVQEKKHAQNYTTSLYYENFTKIINRIAREQDGR